MSDPIVSTIVAGVLWFFVGGFVSGVLYLVGFVVSAVFIDKRPGVSFVAVILGGVLASASAVFVLIQVILHIVTLVQLIIQGA